MTAEMLYMPTLAFEAEACVLGAILLHNPVAWDVAQILRPGHFADSRYGAIYGAMRALLDAGVAVDTVTLTAELNRRRELETVGGNETVARLMDAVPTAVNAVHYAHLVADAGALRQLVRDARDTLAEVEANAAPVSELVAAAEGRALALLEDRAGTTEAVPLGVLLEAEMRRIEARKPAPGLHAGWSDLDDLLGGLRPGQLVILAARPSVGKSSLAYCLCRHVAEREGVPVLLVSLEVGGEQVAQALLAQRSGLNASKLAEGRLGEEERSRAVYEARQLQPAPILVDDRSTLTLSALRARCRVACARQSVGLVVVDYLQLLDGERRRGESRAEEVGRISRMLKSIAKECRVPVVALAQLNREVEARDSHRPRLSDLRESGSIEADADIVLLLYREHMHRDSAPPTKAEVIVAKHRGGPTGTVELVWQAACLRFASARPEREAARGPE